MIKIKIEANDQDQRLDKFLFKTFEITFSLAQKLIREKKVKLNGAKIEPSHKILENDEVDIHHDLKPRGLQEKNHPIISKQKIEKFFSWKIFEDENILAIDKPSGVAVQGRSLKDVSIDDILNQLKKDNVNFFLVHRIDRDTSGVLLLAKNKKAAALLSECFKDKIIAKTYFAIVYGDVKKEKGEINIPLKKKKVGLTEKVYPDFEQGQEAISKFILKKNFGEYSFLELMPITGRTHQLRVHCKEIGHPIIGDVKYGGKKVSSKRLCLHAMKVEIKNYFGKKLLIEAPMPEFLRNF
jgi:23S rRNA pseudouridine955/2504/2580 synthase